MIVFQKHMKRVLLSSQPYRTEIYLIILVSICVQINTHVLFWVVVVAMDLNFILFSLWDK